jgi:hypothetical protein
MGRAACGSRRRASPPRQNWLRAKAAYFDQACQLSIPVNGATARAKLPTSLEPHPPLLMLTGPRREEVAGMTWAELSEDLTTWTIPATRPRTGFGL